MESYKTIDGVPYTLEPPREYDEPAIQQVGLSWPAAILVVAMFVGLIIWVRRRIAS